MAISSAVRRVRAQAERARRSRPRARPRSRRGRESRSPVRSTPITSVARLPVRGQPALTYQRPLRGRWPCTRRSTASTPRPAERGRRGRWSQHHVLEPARLQLPARAAQRAQRPPRGAQRLRVEPASDRGPAARRQPVRSRPRSRSCPRKELTSALARLGADPVGAHEQVGQLGLVRAGLRVPARAGSRSGSRRGRRPARARARSPRRRPLAIPRPRSRAAACSSSSPRGSESLVVLRLADERVRRAPPACAPASLASPRLARARGPRRPRRRRRASRARRAAPTGRRASSGRATRARSARAPARGGGPRSPAEAGRRASSRSASSECTVVAQIARIPHARASSSISLGVRLAGHQPRCRSGREAATAVDAPRRAPPAPARGAPARQLEHTVRRAGRMAPAASISSAVGGGSSPSIHFGELCTSTTQRQPRPVQRTQVVDLLVEVADRRPPGSRRPAAGAGWHRASATSTSRSRKERSAGSG